MIYEYEMFPSPTATIFKTVNGNDTTAPVVASFSSRGPSQVTPDILKVLLESNCPISLLVSVYNLQIKGEI